MYTAILALLSSTTAMGHVINQLLLQITTGHTRVHEEVKPC